jgi:hypothetical protein
MEFMKKICIGFVIFVVAIGVSFGIHDYLRRQEKAKRKFIVSLSDQWKRIVPNNKTQELPEDVAVRLKQPFFFLGQGRQTLVFKSADGTCVLKLFKNITKKRKQRRVRESLLGAYLAKEKLPKETGMIFCSIGGLTRNTFPVSLLNKKGKIETVDLSSTPFILQQKVQPLKETLVILRANGKLQEAQECIQSVFELLATCRDKQVVDRDGALIRNGNIGLIGTKAVLIDTGKLCVLTDRTKQTLHDLNRLRPLVSWCKEAYPELLPTIKQCQVRYNNS